MEKIIIFYPHIQAFGGIERNIIGTIKEIERKKKKQSKQNKHATSENERE